MRAAGVGVEAGHGATDLILELAEALEAGGEAFEDERDVGGAEGARDVGEVGGFGALTERSDEALGPGGDHRDDEEEQEVGEGLPDSFEPGGGGCWSGEGGPGWHGGRM